MFDKAMFIAAREHLGVRDKGGHAYIAKKSGEVYISHNEASKHRFPIYRKIYDVS